MALEWIAKIFGGKNPIEQVGKLADRFIRTKEDKDNFFKELAILEKSTDLKAQEFLIRDRESARSREVEMAKAGKSDWLKLAVGLMVMASFIFVVVAMFVFEIPDKNLFYFLAGNVFSMVVAIVTYFFGSSQSSANKQGVLDKYLENQKKR